MKVIYIGIVYLVVASLVGCDRHYKRDGDPKQQPVTKALKLIDNNRPDEAAVIFEELHEQHPENDEITVGLASAYAAMAGLRVADFYDLFSEAIFNKPLVELQGKTSPQKYRALFGKRTTVPAESFASPKRAEAEMTVIHLRDGLLMTLQLSELLGKLPVVSEEKQIFAEEAVALLDQLVNPQRSHFGFRALMRATLLKEKTLKKIYDERGATCNFDVSALVLQLEEVDQELSQFLRDVGLAYPKEKKDLVKASQQFHTSVSELFKSLQVDGRTAFEQKVNLYLGIQGQPICQP